MKGVYLPRGGSRPKRFDRSVALYILPIAFLVRLSVALFHYYITPLPGGTADAINFERVAWELSASGVAEIFSSFNYSAAYIYSLLMAFPYALFGRNPLLLQALSVLVGTYCVYLTWKLSKEVWGRRSAKVAAWIVAFFPTLIMYSALTMREVYFIAFFLLGTLYLVRWTKECRWRHAGGSSLMFAAGAAFHPAALAGLTALMTLVAMSAFNRLLRSLLHSRLSLHAFVFLTTAALLAPTFIWLDPSLPKIGSLTNVFDPQTHLKWLDIPAPGSAAYPEWLTPRTPFDLIWTIPLRAVYLLFSPFIWDIHSIGHLIGLFDSALYIGLALAMTVNYRHLSRNSAALAVLLVLIIGIVMLGAGTGNFGTALRHRAKLLPLLAVLAGPSFARIVFIKKTAEDPVTVGHDLKHDKVSDKLEKRK